jgi:hypothetical protein
MQHFIYITYLILLFVDLIKYRYNNNLVDIDIRQATLSYLAFGSSFRAISTSLSAVSIYRAACSSNKNRLKIFILFQNNWVWGPNIEVSGSYFLYVFSHRTIANSRTKINRVECANCTTLIFLSSGRFLRFRSVRICSSWRV